MKNTTLCYIENGGRYLMLHRIKKENDENHDKWIGVGGKVEGSETPFECAAREIDEETGLTGLELKYRGLVTFISNEYPAQYMHLFTALSESEALPDNCDEGELVWVAKEKITELPIWEGDKIFLRLLAEDAPFFSVKLVYENDTLKDAVREM